MKIQPELTDQAVLEELGARLSQHRIQAARTQAQLAREAGVSKSTVERLESGRSVDFALLVRVLRQLKLSEGLDGLVPDAPLSPIALLKNKGRQRQRASRPRSAAGTTPRPWRWKE